MLQRTGVTFSEEELKTEAIMDDDMIQVQEDSDDEDPFAEEEDDEWDDEEWEDD